MTAPRPALPATQVEEAILRRVTERADAWYPGTGTRPVVRLRPLRVRPRAALYRVDIGEPRGQRAVLAKVRRGWPGEAQEAGARPRLAASLLPASEQTALEFAGLTALHAVFGSGSDRFAAVRPLDHLVDEDTILLEYVDAPTLRAAFARSSRISAAGRLRGNGLDEEALRRSGAWLGVVQRQLPHAGLPARQATRDEVVDRFTAFAAFLTGRLGADTVGGAVRGAARLAADVLPERLPLVLGHGDYAPRNVFRLADGRVAVFDPLFRWAVPREEDLCRFLVALRLPAGQVHTHGAAYSTARLARYEQAVLEGYGAAEQLRPAELRCYQLLITLDRWCALVAAPSASWPGRLRQTSLRWASSHLRTETRRLTALVEADAW